MLVNSAMLLVWELNLWIYMKVNISHWNFDRRAIMTGRAVRVNSQLKSHKRFANAFPRFCKLVDDARLYCTNDVGGPPQVNSNIFARSCDEMINFTLY